MEESDAPAPPPRLLWPRFALLAVVLAVVLAVIWMSVLIRRTREQMQWAPFPGEQTTPAESSVKTNAALPAEDRLAEFRDLLHGGDAKAGRSVFFYKPEANCGKCHRAGGQGGDNGPALDGIGARQSREFVLESIVYPNAVINTNFETVIVLLKGNSGNSGTLKSESPTELVLNTPDDGLVTFQKSDIVERRKGVSPMPEGIWQLLSRDDLRNVIEYVSTLPALN